MPAATSAANIRGVGEERATETVNSVFLSLLSTYFSFMVLLRKMADQLFRGGVTSLDNVMFVRSGLCQAEDVLVPPRQQLAFRMMSIDIAGNIKETSRGSQGGHTCVP